MYGTHEAITRKGQPAAPMRIEDVVLRPMDGYPHIEVFRCGPLQACLQKSACKSNFLSHKSVSCKSCPVGMIHAGVESARTAIEVMNDGGVNIYERTAAKNSLSCIRCLKSAATNMRLIAGMRLIRGCICVSCFNREREVISGRNSKNARPVKWACLRQTVLTIEDESGKWKTLEPIMTTGRDEAERYVERKHPGHTIVECFFDGVAIQPTEKAATFADIAREAGLNVDTARSRMRKHGSLDAPASRKAKALPAASDYEAAQTEDAPAWLEVFGNQCAQQPGEETVSDYGFDSENLADFVEWIAKDWPAFAHKPAEPFVAVAAPVAHVESVEPVSEPIEPVADDVQSGIEQGIEDEWADVAVSGADGVHRMVRDLAAADGVTPVEYARRRGWIAEDEPEPVAAPAPISEPAFERTRKLTKAEKKAEKKARKRDATARQSKSNGLAPTMLANTCKAFVHVMFELAAER